MNQLIGYLLMGFGGLWTAMALCLWHLSRRFAKSAVASVGRVTNVVSLPVREGDRKRQYGWYPVVEFTLPTGAPVVVTIKNSTVRKSCIGRPVRIRYQPGNHDNATLVSTANALGPLLTVTIGVALVGAGFFLNHR